MLGGERHDEARNERRGVIDTHFAVAIGSIAAIEAVDESSLRRVAPLVPVVDACR